MLTELKSAYSQLLTVIEDMNQSLFDADYQNRTQYIARRIYKIEDLIYLGDYYGN